MNNKFEFVSCTVIWYYKVSFTYWVIWIIRYTKKSLIWTIQKDKFYKIWQNTSGSISPCASNLHLCAYTNIILSIPQNPGKLIPVLILAALSWMYSAGGVSWEETDTLFNFVHCGILVTVHISLFLTKEQKTSFYSYIHILPLHLITHLPVLVVFTPEI